MKLPGPDLPSSPHLAPAEEAEVEEEAGREEDNEDAEVESDGGEAD